MDGRVRTFGYELALSIVIAIPSWTFWVSFERVIGDQATIKWFWFIFFTILLDDSIFIIIYIVQKLLPSIFLDSILLLSGTYFPSSIWIQIGLL